MEFVDEKKFKAVGIRIVYISKVGGGNEYFLYIESLTTAVTEGTEMQSNANALSTT
jgi:hypothetical protein